MKIQHLMAMGGIALSAFLSGCIDDKYDLSDIDTTSEFKVKDLVLPVNLDPIYLSDIIKVKEGDKLKDTTINGQTFYAVVQKGEFYSDPISIDKFEAHQRLTLNRRLATFVPGSGSGVAGQRGYNLDKAVVEDILYTNEAPIDGALRELDIIYFEQDLVFTIDISTESLPAGVGSQLQDAQIELPKGLLVSSVTAGGKSYPSSCYLPSTGILTLPTVDFAAEGSLQLTSIVVNATGMSLDAYGDDQPFQYDAAAESGKFDLKSKFAIEDSRLVLSGQQSEIDAIAQVDYDVDFNLTQIYAGSVIGLVQYELEGEGLKIDPIDLEDLPTFLDDPETNLILANPQIYLGLDNPVSSYGLGYQSYVDIMAIRPDSEKKFDGPIVKVPADNKSRFNYVLAQIPDAVSNIPEEYAAGLTREKYDGLSDIVQGNGLPDKLDVELKDPKIAGRNTSPFYLGQEIQGIDGEYLFLAPLALNEGSQIIKTEDGWWSEDLADLTITSLTVTALATNDLPMDAILTVYPIDRDGKKIETATRSSAKLEAGAKDEPIELTMTGVITDLDGIKIYVLSGSDNTDPLAPDQVIILDNLKAKVTGNYIRKL